MQLGSTGWGKAGSLIIGLPGGLWVGSEQFNFRTWLSEKDVQRLVWGKEVLCRCVQPELSKTASVEKNRKQL